MDHLVNHTFKQDSMLTDYLKLHLLLSKGRSSIYIFYSVCRLNGREISDSKF